MLQGRTKRWVCTSVALRGGYIEETWETDAEGAEPPPAGASEKEAETKAAKNPSAKAPKETNKGEAKPKKKARPTKKAKPTQKRKPTKK